MNHPDLVREMSQSMSLHLGKPTYITKALAPMLGNGILRSNGTLWAQQRKIIAAQFFMDKVKVLLLLLYFFQGRSRGSFKVQPLRAQLIKRPKLS